MYGKRSSVIGPVGGVFAVATAYDLNPVFCGWFAGRGWALTTHGTTLVALCRRQLSDPVTNVCNMLTCNVAKHVFIWAALYHAHDRILVLILLSRCSTDRDHVLKRLAEMEARLPA